MSFKSAALAINLAIFEMASKMDATDCHEKSNSGKIDKTMLSTNINSYLNNNVVICYIRVIS